jgi:CubicO group peptidase (beta-lactamase class C family)
MKERDEQLPDVSIADVDRSVSTAIHEKLFSAAACMASVQGEVFHRKVYGCLESPPPMKKVQEGVLFDLASLSKPLGAGLAVLWLAGRGRIDLQAPIGRVLKEFSHPKFKDITIDMLLDHTSGWPADVSFWECADGAANKEAAMRAHIASLELQAPPGTQTLYSDVGFIVLGWIVESIVAKPLDVFLEREIYKPLGVADDLFFIRHDDFKTPRKLGRRQVVATQDCPVRKKRIVAEVHDPKAWLLGGVAGHAGLFGTVEAVWRLVEMLRLCYRGDEQFFHPGTVRKFFTRSGRLKGTTRTLAWDTPSAKGTLAGDRASKGSVGHLGFTGTSIWLDLSLESTTVVLSNVVHPSPKDKKPRMQKFRRKVQDYFWMEAELLMSKNETGKGSKAF